MKSLVQRAADAYPFMGDISFMSIATRNQAIASRDGYIRGAVEQRLTDIDRAYEWLIKNADDYIDPQSDWLHEDRLAEDLRKYMMSDE